jgi:hypothetical protein
MSVGGLTGEIFPIAGKKSTLKNLRVREVNSANASLPIFY